MTPAIVAEKAKCPNCGAPVGPERRRCAKCGAALGFHGVSAEAHVAMSHAPYCGCVVCYRVRARLGMAQPGVTDAKELCIAHEWDRDGDQVTCRRCGVLECPRCGGLGDPDGECSVCRGDGWVEP